MSKAVYVAAIWSYAHATWCEFVVSSDAAKVRAVCAPLVQFTATHIRVVRVERDDWDLIRPALAALGAPPKSYTPKELEMFCDERRNFADSVLSAAERVDAGQVELGEAGSVERRARGVRRVA